MAPSGTGARNRSGEEHKEYLRYLRYLSMSKLLDFLLGVQRIP